MQKETKQYRLTFNHSDGYAGVTYQTHRGLGSLVFGASTFGHGNSSMEIPMGADGLREMLVHVLYYMIHPEIEIDQKSWSDEVTLKKLSSSKGYEHSFTLEHQGAEIVVSFWVEGYLKCVNWETQYHDRDRGIHYNFEDHASRDGLRQLAEFFMECAALEAGGPKVTSRLDRELVKECLEGLK